MIAVKRGDIDMATFLMASGANIEAKSVTFCPVCCMPLKTSLWEESGNSLMLAARNKNIALANVLILKGADIEARSRVTVWVSSLFTKIQNLTVRRNGIDMGNEEQGLQNGRVFTGQKGQHWCQCKYSWQGNDTLNPDVVRVALLLSYWLLKMKVWSCWNCCIQEEPIWRPVNG